jgi:hypothetical protein
MWNVEVGNLKVGGLPKTNGINLRSVATSLFDVHLSKQRWTNATRLP